jgi:chromosome segregation ATPase
MENSNSQNMDEDFVKNMRELRKSIKQKKDKLAELDQKKRSLEEKAVSILDSIADSDVQEADEAEKKAEELVIELLVAKQAVEDFGEKIGALKADKNVGVSEIKEVEEKLSEAQKTYEKLKKDTQKAKQKAQDAREEADVSLEKSRAFRIKKSRE